MSLNAEVLGRAYEALAYVEQASGEQERAQKDQHRAVEIYEHAFGADDSHTIAARKEEKKIRSGG